MLSEPFRQVNEPSVWNRTTPTAFAGSVRPQADRSSVRLSKPALRIHVPRLARQPRVLDGDAHGEVIQALEGMAGEPEDVVNRVVEKAPDAGGPRAGRFRLE